ncbi:DUF6247 family protein [Thermocatellispora tengchongensis]|uniref:DUF6247 family protein n=1 Tax=Thermocatellispora tengchongensis TaxID=1073253 RepID=UPI00362816DC
MLDEVGVSLDLGAPNAFAHRWWISACDSAKDPEGRRRMHAQAGRALAGDPVPQGRPWREMGRLAGGAVLCTGARDAS